MKASKSVRELSMCFVEDSVAISFVQNVRKMFDVADSWYVNNDFIELSANLEAHCLSILGHVWHVQSELVSYFSHSAKRTERLSEEIEAAGLLGHKKKLHSLSRTRWTER